MKRIIIVIAVLILFTGTANAELFNRGTDSLGNRLIYDDDLDITWYDYTKSLDNWWNQMNWASGLSVDFEGTIYDDWRLPIIYTNIYGCYGNECTNSEMGHIFYTELGNTGFDGYDYESGYGLKNTGDFEDLQSIVYWSGTNTYADSTVYAAYFSFGDGHQHSNTKDWNRYGIAVRQGDVAVSVVPEPISSILFITGGAVLAGRRFLKG